MPRSNRTFWSEKLRRNVERDRNNVDALVRKGWRVGIVWQCWIGSGLNEAKVAELIAFLRATDVARQEWPSPR